MVYLSTRTKDMSIKMVNMRGLEYIGSHLFGRNKENGIRVNYMGASRFLNHLMTNFIGDNIKMGVRKDLEQQLVGLAVNMVIPGNIGRVAAMGMELTDVMFGKILIMDNTITINGKVMAGVINGVRNILESSGFI
jgi:hypothetical protein